MLERFTDHYIRDPLRDDNLGPKGLPGYERSGRAFGRGIESLGRVALTAGLPLLGAGAGYALSGSHLGTMAGAGIGALGSAGMLANNMSQAALPLVESSAGSRAGAFVGRQLDAMSPRENHLVERIKDMSPAQGLAYIQMMERGQSEQPHVLQAMKDAYNTRRVGVQEQLKVSYEMPKGIPSGNEFLDPMDNDTAPQGLSDWHRPLKRLGGTLGSLASVALPAAAGGLLEHAAFGTSGAVGAGLGAVSGIPFAGLGRDVGKHVGRGIGNFAERFQPADNHLVESIKQMNPQDAYVHIRELERAGKTSPETLKTLKDAYNYRRDGLALQSRAGVGL